MRAGRLLTLLLVLQSGGRVTAAELAQRLQVSERTVLRDIESLSGAGVPVYAVRGREGGFELLDGYRVGLAGLPAWHASGPNRRRVGVRVSPLGLRTAALTGRPLRVRRQPRWEPATGRSDWVEATLLVESLEDARLALLALGSEVEVVTPPELRGMLAGTARAMAGLYAGGDEPPIRRVPVDRADGADAGSNP